MAQTYKVLAQADPAATTPTTVYTVPASTTAVISSVVFANRSASAVTFRLYVRVAAEALTNKQYLAYDMNLPANDSIFLQLGITLAATDLLCAYVSAQQVAINVFGVENT
jgi:hypothetical protein